MYFHHRNLKQTQQKHENFKYGKQHIRRTNVERILDPGRARAWARSKRDLRGKNVFNLCVTFLWIFLCIYVLSKLTQLVELFLCQRLLGQKQWYDVRTIKNEWEQTLQLYEDDKSQLDAQVRELREKNLSMERLMVDLRDYNIHLISENYMLSVMHEQVNKTNTKQPTYLRIYWS